jgi:hypothetical protein
MADHQEFDEYVLGRVKFITGFSPHPQNEHQVPLSYQ